MKMEDVKTHEDLIKFLIERIEEKHKGKQWEQWENAVAECQKLSGSEVLCLFVDGWQVSSTGGHTHKENYLHFKKGELLKEKFPIIQEYFSRFREDEDGNVYGRNADELLKKGMIYPDNDNLKIGGKENEQKN